MDAVLEKTAGADLAGMAGKYLTFALGDEEFGIEILKVREIIGLMDITKVPRVPEYVRGVINLRGKVIPVADLRLKFGMESIEDSAQTCIIVVDLGTIVTGIVVDRVLEVLYVNGSEIEDTPEFGAGVDTRFISGIGKTKGRVVMLLNISDVLSERIEAAHCN